MPYFNQTINIEMFRIVKRKLGHLRFPPNWMELISSELVKEILLKLQFQQIFWYINRIGFQFGFGNFDAVAVLYPAELLKAFGFFQ
ncbi:hypothetical protein SAMN05428975_2793 [Mucilaginibacter sp. OK268]|nr:hypothetical protein SAMN05428975_2793 [Mucilaginibacter sp. OK268]